MDIRDKKPIQIWKTDKKKMSVIKFEKWKMSSDQKQNAKKKKKWKFAYVNEEAETEYW